MKSLQDVTSLRRYIRTTEEIQVHRNRSAIFRHRLPLVLAAYKAAYYALLWPADGFSREERTVAYNAFYQLAPDQPGVNLFSGLFAVMLAYLQYQYYFVGNRPMNGLLLDVLDHHHQEGHSRRARGSHHAFFLWSSHRGRDLADYMRRFYLLIVNGAQVFVLINYISILRIHYILAVCFVQENSWNNGGDKIFYLLKLATHLLNGLLFDLYIVYFTGLGVLIICCSTTLLRLGLIKLQQTNRLLANIRKSRDLSQLTFHRFRAAHLGTLTFFEPSNRYYGRIFTAFLAVNFPASVWMLVFNVVNLGGSEAQRRTAFAGTGNSSSISSSKLFSANLLLMQGFIIFAVHIAMAQWPRLIHQPAKVLLDMMASHHYYHQHHPHNQEVYNTQNGGGDGGSNRKRRHHHHNHLLLLLQVDHLIDVLHRRNLYTLSYGSFGSITTRTFARFLLFYYCKLLMICFKMIRSGRG